MSFPRYEQFKESGVESLVEIGQSVSRGGAVARRHRAPRAHVSAIPAPPREPSSQET
jgi:hypothetical protein